MSSIQLRQGRTDDYDALHRLYVDVDSVHHAALPGYFKSVDEIGRRDVYLDQVLADDNSIIVVAEIEDIVVGFVHAGISEIKHPLLKSYNSGYISDLVVERNFRNQGIGVKLLDSVENWHIDNSVYEVSLTVFSFNSRAEKFYQRNGFATESSKMVKVYSQKQT